MVTYVVYDSDLSDRRSAEFVAEKMGFTLLQTPEAADPSVYSPQHDENDIVCIGGWDANAYTKYYFPKLRYDNLLNPKKFPDNPEMWRWAGDFGISADGKRIVHTVRRANGTTVTIIAGVLEPDTWRAVNDYCKAKLPLVSLPFIGGGFVLAVGIQRGVGRGKRRLP